MNLLKILVVEDEEVWQQDLEEAIRIFWDASARVDVVADLKTALQLLDEETYDLAIVDLNLSGIPIGQFGSDTVGMELLIRIREHPRNKHCVIIVHSGYSENEIRRLAVRALGANDYLVKVADKGKFDPEKFVGWWKEALFDGRVKRATDSTSSYNRLTFKFNQTGITGYELSGPGLRRTVQFNLPAKFDSDDLTRRGDKLNRDVLIGGSEVWRPEADSIGRDIQRMLSDNRLLDDLSAVQTSGAKKAWLQFSGPAKILGVPFELWQNAGNYLCRHHPLTRRYEIHGLAQNTSTFHGLLESLRNGRLRVLVVGSNSDGNVPAVDEEAELVAETINEETQRLGLNCGVKLLKSSQADYDTVCGELKNGGYHIFHYAGHGRHDDK
ncbi:MAG: response regulator, partial [Blastocatellia bacterium]